MSYQVMKSTQVTFTFSIQVKTDREDELIKALFLLFTLPVILFCSIRRKISRFTLRLSFLAMDIQDLLSFIYKVLTIHVKAYTWGLLGVTL